MRRLIAVGTLSPGAAVPSVRDLARDLQVNPATVSKAYQRLTDRGVLAVRRGDGTYVADRPPARSDEERAAKLGQAALRYASLAVTLGADREEAVASVETALASLGNGKP